MLPAGTTLGPYQIVAPIGAGGMGEVYRAHDSRLGRDVAIKVLPPHLATAPEVRARFEREARTISQLNHPHICTLHDVGHQEGLDYLVMELVEGETLAHRLEKGPLAVAEVLTLGIQIADALDRAHRAGVVHRDLKPGNVMLTKSGAKLMDFGLARAAGLSPAAPGLMTESPTVSRPLTAEGTIVGTFQYMSPELLEGREADARSDLWALGCVLYEAATGKRAFEGRSQASLIAAIIEREPTPPSQLMPVLPPALDRVVQQCLTKDPDERIQTAHDVKLELEWIASGGSQAGVPAPLEARRRSRERLAWTLALAAGVAAMALGGALLLRRAPEPVVARFHVGPEAGARNIRWPRLSPDGRLLAYLADDTARVSRIWVRRMDAFTATPLPGTENVARPFWSPDSRSLAFVSGNQMKRIAVGGGPAQLVGELRRGADGSWGTRGVILFDGTQGDSIRQIPAEGGEVAPATRIDRARGEAFHTWPTFLPDGRRFLFLAERPGTEMSVLKLGRLGSLESSDIGPVPSRVEYSPTGHLLYVQDGTLMARPFDAARARFTGGPFPVVEQVMANGEQAHISVSSTGVIAYGAGSAGERSSLTWVDRGGRTLGQLGAPDWYANPVLSPDGTCLAYEQLDPGNGASDIWTRDLRRGIATRVTFDPRGEVWPTWSPDGRRLAYALGRGDEYVVLVRAADGTGAVDTVYRSSAPAGPTCWSRDGKSLFLSRYESFYQLWVTAPTPGARATQIQQTRFTDFDAQPSPDGRWLAYATNETGRLEVFVQAYPGPGGKWRVSTAGGGVPRWRADGRELFYRATDGQVMAVPIRTEGAALDAGAPVALFQRASPSPFPFRDSYDVSPDGRRFLVNALAGERDRAGAIDVVIGWAAETRKKR